MHDTDTPPTTATVATATTSRPTVDRNRVLSSQAATALLLTAAFLTDAWPLAAAVAVANVVAGIAPRSAPFGLLYDRVLRPAGIVHPLVLADDPTPHRFAAGMSGTVTAASAALVAAGLGAAWALSLLVVVLAVLNLTIGFCAGCFTWHQLRRHGVVATEASS